MVDALDHLLLTGDPENDERFLISLVLSRHFWVVGALVLVLPFSFYRTLDELKKASALALVFVFMLAGMIIAYANGIADPCMGNEENANTCRGAIEPVTNYASTISKVPIFLREIWTIILCTRYYNNMDDIEYPNKSFLELTH